MAAAVRVRRDYEAAQIRVLAKRSKNAAQTRRLLALAAIYDGGSRTEAARIGGVGLQTVRDWVLAFNAEGPSGLVNGKALGNAPLLSDVNRQALMQIVESGPIPAVHGVVRWGLIDQVQEVGTAGDAACRAARSAHPLGLHLWGHLPGPGECRWPHPAALQYRRNGVASGRNLSSRHPGSACRSAARSGRLAPLGQAQHSCQHHLDAIAAKVAGTQSGRKHLAVHPRQLALQPCLPLLRRHPRALLLCLE